MPRPLYRVVLLLGAVLLPSYRLYAQSENVSLPEHEQLRLGVHFYNYAGISDGEVRAAEKVVAGLLSEARIQLEWTGCITNQGASGSTPSPCAVSARSTDLVLYFVGPLEQHSKWASHNALGYSIIPNGNEFATMAYVSYPRIQRLSADTRVDVAELFGLAVAHEIGHLLFGSRDHADLGIMRAPWRVRDLENRDPELNFTQDQSRRLRAGVQKRLRFDELGINSQQMTSHQSASQRPSLTYLKNEHRIPFRARNGFVYIPARVNGGQATLLLDTGAALTTFSLKIAPTTDSESRITIHMAKGSVAGFRVPAGFTLGDSEFEAERYSLRRTVVVGDFNFGEADGVIGLDILSSFKSVTIDFQNSILILEDR